MLEHYNGVIRIRALKNDLYEEEDIDSLLKGCIKLNNGEPVRILMDMIEHDIVLSNSAKAYFFNAELAKEMVIGEAVVIKSTVGSVMFDILLRASRPSHPMRSFTDIEKAHRWLIGLPDKQTK